MFLNNSKFCLACFGKPEKEKKEIWKGKISTIVIPLIKHHVKYIPEEIGYVHYKCHNDIHDGKFPHLIQYQEG